MDAHEVQRQAFDKVAMGEDRDGTMEASVLDLPPERPQKVKGVPEEYLTQDGEVDLRKMTGAQAVRFLGAQGIRFPIVPRKG